MVGVNAGAETAAEDQVAADALVAAAKAKMAAVMLAAYDITASSTSMVEVRESKKLVKEGDSSTVHIDKR
jgi:hypothetical protein